MLIFNCDYENIMKNITYRNNVYILYNSSLLHRNVHINHIDCRKKDLNHEHQIIYYLSYKNVTRGHIIYNLLPCERHFTHTRHLSFLPTVTYVYFYLINKIIVMRKIKKY